MSAAETTAVEERVCRGGRCRSSTTDPVGDGWRASWNADDRKVVFWCDRCYGLGPSDKDPQERGRRGRGGVSLPRSSHGRDLDSPRTSS